MEDRSRDGDDGDGDGEGDDRGDANGGDGGSEDSSLSGCHIRFCGSWRHATGAEPEGIDGVMVANSADEEVDMAVMLVGQVKVEMVEVEMVEVEMVEVEIVEVMV